MKIAYVVPGGVDRSGTHRVIPHLVERLGRLAERHEVHVFAMRQEPRPGRWTLGGAHVHNVGARPRRLRCLAQLASEHRRSEFDLVHAVFMLPQAVVAASFGWARGVPVVAEEPGGAFASLPDIGWGGWHRWQGRWWVRSAMRGVDRLLVPSELARREAEERGFGAVVAPWGTSGSAWPVTMPVRRTDARLRIGWIGTLNEVKDPWTMLRVAKRLADDGVDFVFEVHGEDTLSGRVQLRAKRMGLARAVRFRGFTPQARLRDAVRNIDGLLVTSRFEGTPRVVHEAAACGVPTVGTDVGVLRSMAPAAAAVAAVGDADGLARHLRRWVSREEERLMMGNAALEWALANDLDRCLEVLDEVYGGVVRGAGALQTAGIR